MKPKKLILVYILLSLALYAIGAFWNYYLWPRAGVFGDIIPWGRYNWSVGDLCVLLSFVIALAVPLGCKEMR